VLHGDRIEPAKAPVELAREEGIFQAALDAAGATLWSSEEQLVHAEATAPRLTHTRLARMSDGQLRCAIAAPLQPHASDITGCLLLGSHRREQVWTPGDLPIVEAVAEESARALDRARRHAADVDQALMDSITGLVSHRQLVNIVEKEVARASRAESTLAIIFSDLDDFKEINDAWGHDAGNRVLRMYADVLRGALRREDTAARYGGDEFVCVLPGADREQARAVADRISGHFAEGARGDPVVGTSHASVSYGIAVFPFDATTAESVLVAADAELIKVKKMRSRSIMGRARRRGARRPA
jgi:diguanylate cyclase (GGDEF)-like protein